VTFEGDAENHRCRRWARAPLKFGGKILGGNYYEKYGHFSSKKSFWNFVNFSGKYHKN